MENIKKLILTTSIFLFTSTTSYAMSAWNPLTALQVQKTGDAAQWGIESVFQETLSEFELTNTILSGQLGFNGNKTYETTMNKVTEIGGAYGEELAGIMDKCFNVDIPSFSKALGLDGLDFCGIGDVQSIVKKVVKKKSDEIKDDGKTTVGKTVTIKIKQNDVIDTCNERTDESCAKKIGEIGKREYKSGSSKDGTVSEHGVKLVGSHNYTNKLGYCDDNELNRGTLEFYACRQDVLNSIERYHNYEDSNNQSANVVTGLDINEVKRKDTLDNEKIITRSKNAINLSKTIRDEYNIRYRPSTTVIEDPKNMDYPWFSKSNEDEIRNNPTLFITTNIGQNGLESNMYGLDDYLTVLNETKDIESLINKTGGYTPFLASYLNYKNSTEMMSKHMYSGDGEKGDLGRQVAMIEGLKSLSLQVTILTQQLENQERTNYNINIKKFNKLSADNDKLIEINTKMMNQNALLLNKIDELIKVIGNK